MNHKGTEKIETDRLILRKFKTSDAKSFYKNCVSDSKVSYYLSWEPHKNVKESEEFIKSLMETYEDSFVYDWAIELKETSEVIGNIKVNNIDDKNSFCHIGYYIGSKFWNKGLMTEALKIVISYLFEETDLNRIVARHDVENIGSGKVMVKANMTYEGTLRECKFRNNKFCSLAVYSILKNEWKNNSLNLFT